MARAASQPAEFPRSADRGPIEARVASRCRSIRLRDFRDQLIAAPLKHACATRHACGAARFPRSADRGPIEARWRHALQRRHPLFPRSADRGPIEALRRASVVGSGSAAFPRSADRGPIEARRMRLRALDRSSSFPRSADRGPIEARYSCERAPHAHAFPRSADRGPIEASAVVIRTASIGRISAIS